MLGLGVRDWLRLMDRAHCNSIQFNSLLFMCRVNIYKAEWLVVVVVVVVVVITTKATSVDLSP
jgi:hypothetical protein